MEPISPAAFRGPVPIPPQRANRNTSAVNSGGNPAKPSSSLLPSFNNSMSSNHTYTGTLWKPYCTVLFSTARLWLNCPMLFFSPFCFSMSILERSSPNTCLWLWLWGQLQPHSQSGGEEESSESDSGLQGASSCPSSASSQSLLYSLQSSASSPTYSQREGCLLTGQLCYIQLQTWVSSHFSTNPLPWIFLKNEYEMCAIDVEGVGNESFSLQ